MAALSIFAQPSGDAIAQQPGFPACWMRGQQQQRQQRQRRQPRAHGRGGASGCCVKSKQSLMPFEAASRGLSGARPKFVPQNLIRLTCEFSWCEMCPGLA